MDTRILLAALQEVEKRAERVSDDDVLATYVNIESLTNALAARDNGIVFGRRGTGKTHALKYVAKTERDKGNRVVYIDLEQDVGSTEGRYADPNLSISERATRLVVDVLSIVHSQMLEAAFAGGIDVQIDVLDQMLDHFGEVLVAQETEREDTRTDRSSEGSTTDVGASWTPGGMPAVKLGAGSTCEPAREAAVRTRQAGVVRHRIHFGGVTRSMRQAIEADEARRFWLLLDEWSGVPIDLQPYLAEMLRRLFFGIPKVTVRIAAIPHRSEWRIAGDRGDYIGAEVGAELFPLLDLDEFVVFPARNREEQARRSLSFFRALLFRHISTALVGMGEKQVRAVKLPGPQLRPSSVWARNPPSPRLNSSRRYSLKSPHCRRSSVQPKVCRATPSALSAAQGFVPVDQRSRSPTSVRPRRSFTPRPRPHSSTASPLLEPCSTAS